MSSKNALLLVLAAMFSFIVACSSTSPASSPPKPQTGTETLNAVVTGSAAAANLNNSNSNAPLTFPEGTWTGPVAVTLKPFALGGNGNAPGDVHWATDQGTVTVYHVPGKGYTNPNATPVATWTKSGTTCGFSTVFSKGTFRYVPTKSTGAFARLSGSGSYTLTAQGDATLKSGKTTCSFSNIGNVTSNDTAKIDFTATAPVTLAPESSTP